MEAISTGAAIVETLEALGVSRVFGIPGYHILDIYDRLGRSQIDHVMGKNEEGVVRTANGAARVTGAPEVAFVSAGPGAINSMTGVGEAHALSIPLVVVAGAEPMRDGPHGIDEPRAVPEMYSELAKGVWYVEDPRDGPEAVVQAFKTAQRGRPGPTIVQIPMDILKRTAPIEIPTEVDETPLQPDEGDLESLAERLDSATRPAIIVGQGALRAQVSDEIHALAEQVDSPVIVTDRGFSGYVQQPRYAGGYSEVLNHPASDEVVARADCFLAVGVRERIRRYFADTLTGERLYLLEDLERYNLGDIAAFGDLRSGLQWLTETCEGQDHEWWHDVVESGWADHKRMLSDDLEAIPDPVNMLPEGGEDPADVFGDSTPAHPAAIVAAINDGLQEDAIVTGDVGVHLGYAMRYLRLNEPGTFLGPENWGAMGHAIPAAVGANIAAPDRQVVALVGDGSLLMNLAELATAAEQRLSLTVVVFDNHQHNAILADQLAQYGATGFTHVPGMDFAAFAESLGATGVRVDSPEGLETKLREALEIDSLSLVSVATQPNVN